MVRRGEAVALTRHRADALLVAAALPALAVPNHLAIGEKAKRLGVPVHDGGRYVGHLARHEPRIVEHLHALRALRLSALVTSGFVTHSCDHHLILLDFHAMTQPLQADPLPLVRDASGVIRVAGTRVSLDSIVAGYETGASIPELAEAFPDLTLPDIHTSIAYYLRHRPEIEEYLETRRREAREVERRIQREFPESYRRLADDAPVASPPKAGR